MKHPTGQSNRPQLSPVAIFIILIFAMACPSCLTLNIKDRWREKTWNFSRRIANIAVLKPEVRGNARESALLQVARPLIWTAEMLSLSFPPRGTPVAVECTDALRQAIGSHLETSGMHVINYDDTDEAVASGRDLVEVGADYLLHVTIENWSRGYLVVQSWVRIRISCQLVRLADGVVVWDGDIETTRATGLLQIGKTAWSLFYSTPVAGIPYAPISALTGPLARIRGTVYYDLLRDSARNLTNHMCPNVLEPCQCDRCSKDQSTNAFFTLLKRRRDVQQDTEAATRQNFVQAVVVGRDDSLTGLPVKFRVGDRFEVLAIAPRDAIVSFDAGNHHRGMPMVRRGFIEREGYNNLALFHGVHDVDSDDFEDISPGSAGLEIRVYAVSETQLHPEPVSAGTVALDRESAAKNR